MLIMNLFSYKINIENCIYTGGIKVLELYANIKKFREARGMSQDELARLVGFKSRSSINKIELGVNDITQSKLVAIANALHTTPAVLMGNDAQVEPPPTPPPNAIPMNTYTYKIPLLGRVAAGEPIYADEHIESYEYIDSRYKDDGNEYFALRIDGQSMEPTIMDGDIVIVRQQSFAENGQIAIVLIDGEDATAKEVRESAEGITLIGHNVAVYTPHFYSHKQIDELPVKIIGVVAEIRRRLIV